MMVDRDLLALHSEDDGIFTLDIIKSLWDETTGLRAFWYSGFASTVSVSSKWPCHAGLNSVDMTEI